MKHLTKRTGITTLGVLLIVLLIILLCGGGYAGVGVLGYGPGLIILIILIVLLLTGRL